MCHMQLYEYYGGGLDVFEASLTKNDKFWCFSVLMFVFFDEALR